MFYELKFVRQVLPNCQQSHVINKEKLATFITNPYHGVLRRIFNMWNFGNTSSTPKSTFSITNHVKTY